MLRIMFVFLIAFLTCQPLRAQSVSLSTTTGGFLARLCENSEGLTADFCMGYIIGVADQLQLTRQICRPSSDVATLQTVEVVRLYIKQNPQRWNIHGAFIVKESLQKAFPC